MLKGEDISELNRVVLSVISWLVAVVVFSVVFAVAGGNSAVPEPRGPLQLFCYGLLTLGYFSLPGWALSLAAVLLVEDARGWRSAALLGFGVVLGPLTDVCVSSRLSGRFGPFHILYPLWMASVFSTAAVLIYVLLLRSSKGPGTAP